MDRPTKREIMTALHQFEALSKSDQWQLIFATLVQEKELVEQACCKPENTPSESAFYAGVLHATRRFMSLPQHKLLQLRSMAEVAPNEEPNDR